MVYGRPGPTHISPKINILNRIECVVYINIIKLI